MATAQVTNVQQPSIDNITQAEAKDLVRGIDMIIASNSRSNARESNDVIRKARDDQNQQLVILKNKLMTKQLKLE